MVATLPSTGKGDWTDFADYWRDADISWMQDRIVLRYDTNAQRDGELGAAGNGQVVYNAALGILQLRHGGAWKNYGAIPSNLVVTTDTNTAAGFSHASAGGKGLTYTPTQIQITADLLVQGGVLTVDTTGVTIKLGTNKAAKLTTNATQLVSDTAVSVPSLTFTGTGTVLDATGKSTALGAASASSLTTTGAINATGAISGSSGSFGGVVLANNEVVAPVNEGLRAGQGWFYGTSTSAVMRQSPDGVTSSPNYVQADANSVNIGGTTGTFEVHPQMRVFEGKPIQWYDDGNVFRGNISPIVYSGSDPGAANFPDGSLWIS